MKTNIRLLLMSLPLIALGGCSEELPWTEKNGYLNRDAMAVEFKNAEHLVRSSDVNVGDFQVEIRKKAASGQGAIVKTYAYSEMPEVVELPTGEYTVNAVYGDNPVQGWDCPYYLGDTDFTIESGKVTEDLDPVVCKLSNVRVTISFGPNLTENMGDDAKVTVQVGNAGSLEFTKKEEREGKSGYFAYVPDSQTITATFSGTIGENEVNETKSYDNVDTGNHYQIAFSLHDAGAADPGDIEGLIHVDASVTTKDMTEDIKPDTEYKTDDMRPVEGEPEPGPGPDDPNQPGPDVPPAGNVPSITAEQPTEAGMVAVDLSKVNVVTDNLYCVLVITSEAEGGIQDFKVVIDSTTLTADELEGVGLKKELDLAHTSSYEGDDNLAEALDGLGFPIDVAGKDKVQFAITDFLPMLSALGPGTHNFELTVTDANGTKKTVLRLETK